MRVKPALGCFPIQYPFQLPAFSLFRFFSGCPLLADLIAASARFVCSLAGITSQIRQLRRHDGDVTRLIEFDLLAANNLAAIGEVISYIDQSSR